MNITELKQRLDTNNILFSVHGTTSITVLYKQYVIQFEYTARIDSGDFCKFFIDRFSSRDRAAYIYTNNYNCRRYDGYEQAEHEFNTIEDYESFGYNIYILQEKIQQQQNIPQNLNGGNIKITSDNLFEYILNTFITIYNQGVISNKLCAECGGKVFDNNNTLCWSCEKGM